MLPKQDFSRHLFNHMRLNEYKRNSIMPDSTHVPSLHRRDTGSRVDNFQSTGIWKSKDTRELCGFKIFQRYRKLQKNVCCAEDTPLFEAGREKKLCLKQGLKSLL